MVKISDSIKPATSTANSTLPSIASSRVNIQRPGQRVSPGGPMSDSAADAQERFQISQNNTSDSPNANDNSPTTSKQNITSTNPQSKFSQAKRLMSLKNSAKTLGTGWFIGALILAGIGDGIGALLALTVIGSALNTILIGPLFMFFIVVIHFINGVPITKKTGSTMMIALLIELIPEINALPALIATVLLSKIIPILESKAKEAANLAASKKSALQRFNRS